MPFGIAAIVMGVIAMSKAKMSPGTHGGRGMALAGLVCGIVGLAVTLVLMVMGLSMQLFESLNH